MKRKITPIIVLSLLFASLMILQISAVEPRSYFEGCADCGANVVAYCDGWVSEEEDSHKYNKFLGIFGGNTCVYKITYHATTEYCSGSTIHKNPGDTVSSESGHTYDDVGKNACGMEDVPSCPLNTEAYRSEI